MVFDLIVEGIGQVVGWELVTGILFLFCFMLFTVSKGLGITALISTFVLSVYLFTENSFSGRYLLSNDVLIFVVICLGLFLGWLVYVIFLRD